MHILSKTHPIGKTKALFFEQAGYTIRNQVYCERECWREVRKTRSCNYYLVDRRGYFNSKIHNCVPEPVEEEDMKELDTVVVNKDIPNHRIERGDIGVVVHTYEDKAAVEVEFVSGEGTTLGVITLQSEDVRLMKKDEILHVRELHTA